MAEKTPENGQAHMSNRRLSFTSRGPSIAELGSAGNIPYHVPVFDAESGCMYSVDNVRLAFRFYNDQRAHDAWTHLDGILTKHEMEASRKNEDPTWWCRESRKRNGWRYLWNMTAGESSITIGMGWRAMNNKVNDKLGWIEFNPNKVGSDKLLARILRMLNKLEVKWELKRWDLAVDVPVLRADCRLQKDKRKYEAVISDSMTEYLGQRSHEGFTKVYDKLTELHLAEEVMESILESSDGNFGITRIELTCSGAWGVGEIAGAWPVVYAPGTPEKWKEAGGFGVGMPAKRRSPLQCALECALADVYSRGDVVEPYLESLDKLTKHRVHKRLAKDGLTIEPSLDAIEALLGQVAVWATGKVYESAADVDSLPQPESEESIERRVAILAELDKQLPEIRERKPEPSPVASHGDGLTVYVGEDGRLVREPRAGVAEGTTKNSSGRENLRE